jgi:hypothetical protein
VVLEREIAAPAGWVEAPCDDRVVAQGLVLEPGARHGLLYFGRTSSVRRRANPEPPRARVGVEADPRADRRPRVEWQQGIESHPSGAGPHRTPSCRRTTKGRTRLPGPRTECGPRLPWRRVGRFNDDSVQLHGKWSSVASTLGDRVDGGDCTKRTWNAPGSLSEGAQDSPAG